MTGKKVSIGLKPGAQKSAEAWITESRERPEEARAPAVETPPPPAVIKRLTIDVSEELHRKLKVKAANEGVRMADLVREWIAERCA